MTDLQHILVYTSECVCGSAAYVYLFCNLLPHGCKCSCSVDILLITDVWNINQDPGLSVDETVQDVFLKGWQVVGDLMAMPHVQGVMAVRE